MIFRDYNKDGYCRHTVIHTGDCCCNCKHRVRLEVDGFPMGYYCNHPLFEDRLIFISYEGHSMCELHEREGAPNIEELEIAG